MSTTTEVEFDYQTYMKENTPEIYRGPEARQKRREAAEARKLPLRRKNRGEITIATVAEFHEQLGNLGTEDETNFLYRGQADVKWSVDCSAARRLTNYSANPIDDQLINSLLVGYLEFLIAKARMRGFISPGLSENSADLEFLAQLQHQGAATGLIDFTRQPLVALWFACNATRKADGAVYVLSRSATRAVSKRDLEDKTIQDFYEQNKLWLWQPSAIGNRIVAQGSIFVFGVPRIYPTKMKQLIVQADKKDNILKELETLYGINEEELFADFSGYAIANASSRIFDVNRTIDYWHEQIELASDSNDKKKKVMAHFNCGVAYSAIKAFKKAIEQYGKAIELNPNFAIAYYNRGIAYVNKDNFKQAIQDFDKAIDLKPYFAEAYNNRGVAYGNKGDFDQATQDYSKAIDLKPDYADAYYNRGVAYGNKGDFDQATQDYSKAIDLKPDYADAYYNRGITYGKKGNLNQAIQDFDKAIDLKPDYAKAYHNRGVAYGNKGDFDQATQDYSKAIDLKPDYAKAYHNRGVAYSDKGDFDQAIQDYNKAIDLKPDFAEVYNSRGIAYSDKDDFDQAIQDYNKAVELNPNNAEAYYNRGNAYSNKGDFDQAIQDYNKAIDLKPDFADAYHNRGIAYSDKDDFDQAIQDYNEAIKLNPNYAEAYNNRGVAYRIKGNFEQAIQDFNEAIKLKLDSAKAYFNRGYTWLHLGEWEKAKTDLTTVKNMGVDIVAMFRLQYGSVADFEREYGLELPEDIAAMLTRESV